MIILDTCVIRGMRLDGSDVEVLRAMVATGTQSVGAPWMAVEELAAQKALEYLDAHRVASRALRQLQLRSHQAEPKLDEPDAEAVRQKWRKQYDFLEVLPTSDNAVRVGLYREANVLPPAGTKGEGEKLVKVGARDVAIWLTAVEYARDHPDERVYFVSSNHRDFTRGEGGYPAPMASDVADLGDRFVHLTNLGELLETVAPRVEVPVAQMQALLAVHTDFVAQRARETWQSRATPFDVRTRRGTVAAAQAWAFPGEDVRVRLVDIGEVEAYQLGASSWVVATARWEFVGVAIGTSPALQQAACWWDTRILFPTGSEDGHTPRIIKAEQAVPVEDASSVEWPAPLKSWEFTQRVLKVAEEEGRTPTWVEILMASMMSLSLVQGRGGPVDHLA
ncbi:PIN domain-containing protein [Streptomyces anulatus]|uniref:PIN domain-containing protein n=1 Tax=Streptomyces anulatus TaxID=1892 RepID=UPI0033FE6F74